jgi:hypothetical protein
MSDKLTLEKLSRERDTLWGRIRELELTISRKLGTTLKNTTRKFRRQPEAGGDAAVISNDRRRRLIELTAYCKAERRGFVGGDPEQDWLEAEREVDRLLLGGRAFLEDTDITTGMPPRQ